MSRLKALHYRSFKYTRWPHSVTSMRAIDEHCNIVFWLLTNLKKSNYRINYDRRSFKWFPQSRAYVSYHFKYSEDLVIFRLRFNV